MDDTSMAPIDLDAKKTVKKSNVLNELRNANASLVEYRLFCVYLAHLPINADSNVVTFRLADYAKIAGLKRPRKEDLESQSENLISMTAKLDTPDGGFRRFSLFSEFKLYRQDDEWMVSLECNPKIAPMIREQKGKFLRYKLYNTIFLKSFNQQRLYELLKQYERIGERTISLPDLRDFLSIEEHQYPVWGVFARDVLKVAQAAMKENTDICFEYEPIKKGRPVVAVKFTITKNRSFVDRLQIDQHMPDVGDADDYDGEELLKRAPELPEYDGQMSLFDVADVAESICKSILPKFTKGSIQEIAASVAAYFASLLPDGTSPSKGQITTYIKQKVASLEARREKQAIPYPASYLKTMIQDDTQRVCQRTKPTNEQAPEPEAYWQPSLGAAELEALQQTLRTVGNDPDIAERAEKLKEELQGK